MKLFRKIGAKLEKMQNKAFEKRLRKMAGLTDSERNSSITAGELYPYFCALAVENDSVFKTFRQNPIYTRVLEHTSYEIGAQYLAIARVSFNAQDFENFKRNDAIGGGGQ